MTVINSIKLISYKTLIATMVVSLLLALSLPFSASAQAQPQAPTNPTSAFINAAGYEEPSDPRTEFSRTVAVFIQLALSFLGVIFVILMIYAGFVWMLSAGNEEKITKAKKTIVAAIIGLAIVLLAYAITLFVVGALVDATGAGGGGTSNVSTS